MISAETKIYFAFFEKVSCLSRIEVLRFVYANGGPKLSVIAFKNTLERACSTEMNSNFHSKQI